MTQTATKYDLYDLFTDDEFDRVTDIVLEALAREKNIVPGVFHIDTIINVDSILED